MALSDSVIAAGYENGDIKLWSPSSDELIEEFCLPDKSINSVSIDSSGEQLLINTKENIICIWDLRMNQELGQVTHPRYRSVNHSNVAWSNDCRYIIAGGYSGAIYIWDAVTMQIEEIIDDCQTAPISCIAYRPRDTEYASVDTQGGLVIWK